MRILYSALRHDPTNPDLASGLDHSFYSAFIRGGAQVKIVGPFAERGTLPERALKRAYVKLTGKRYLKWNVQLVIRSARELSLACREWRPDLIFGLFPPPLAFYVGGSPCVLGIDTTFRGQEALWPLYGRLPLRLLIWQERRAARKSALIIAFSEWSKQDIMAQHGVGSERVLVQPMPSALPEEVVPKHEDFRARHMETPLHLLLVGREYERKGIRVAVEATRLLNARGMPAELTICGIPGRPDGPVRYAGPFKKSVPSELGQYAGLYAAADFLIHPAIFEAAGIVPAEAAAFGVPTITNAVGGLATSVADGVSGVVLPPQSPAEAYFEAVARLVRNPSEYTRLSVGARRRYEEEQNWSVAGARVMKSLDELVTLCRG